ncbi:MAG: hypothetical protein K0Q79_993 [Flavipsychrobacter sp.]|jgi:hypothetical protein|nr:hypothetical protein [Flavipsychrobacter sp.]
MNDHSIRWQTPISDNRNVYYKSLTFLKDEKNNRELLVYCVEDNETKMIYEFTFITPGAVLICWENLRQLGDTNWEMGMTSTTKNSSLINLLNPDTFDLSYSKFLPETRSYVQWIKF